MSLRYATPVLAPRVEVFKLVSIFPDGTFSPAFHDFTHQWMGIGERWKYELGRVHVNSRGLHSCPTHSIARSLLNRKKWRLSEETDKFAILRGVALKWDKFLWEGFVSGDDSLPGYCSKALYLYPQSVETFTVPYAI